MDIKENEFMRYENVRLSGVTNMWAVNVVMELSDLTREQVMDIMRNYTTYKKKFMPEVPGGN